MLDTPVPIRTRKIGIIGPGEYLDERDPQGNFRFCRLSTVDRLALSSLDQLLLILNTLFTFLQKQATLMRRSTVPNLPLPLVFPNSTLMVTTFLTGLASKPHFNSQKPFLWFDKMTGWVNDIAP